MWCLLDDVFFWCLEKCSTSHRASGQQHPMEVVSEQTSDAGGDESWVMAVPLPSPNKRSIVGFCVGRCWAYSILLYQLSFHDRWCQKKKSYLFWHFVFLSKVLSMFWSCFLNKDLKKLAPVACTCDFMARRLLCFRVSHGNAWLSRPRAWIRWWDCFASFAFP